ncbi:sulfur oxidation c-type cytochrome SoxA [Paucibacter sp. R3-3]|uniref:L-cysteine S-thiosulfotransferase subunit SoxA n=1 Tax=Roseateles agri TaxID=3098619 RepID=A0ABU5DLM0_9BURK|nr:sulfur oxidation c-type cytochrome SoxA [Paucibacter sp. R3-3]MDY0747205.1 sulfur oxidation c-type cytochrome SoxA [Paucibacter sp. R3-3]
MRRALVALLLLPLLLGASAPRRSGYDMMSPALQAMQRDDGSNPAMLWADGGRALWQQWACGRCHAPAEQSMRGVAARYPAFDAALKKPITLAQRIQQCRRLDHGAELPPESEDLLSISAWIALQSRGQPVAPPADERLQPFRARGQVLFERRIGQLNLSCAQCHDQRAGEKLGGSTIPEAHPTGYPLYRLEWQGLGSLQRRLRNCAAGVRAQPWDWNAEEMVDLELYLMQRAAGMAMDAPAVRP